MSCPTPTPTLHNFSLLCSTPHHSPRPPLPRAWLGFVSACDATRCEPLPLAPSPPPPPIPSSVVPEERFLFGTHLGASSGMFSCCFSLLAVLRCKACAQKRKRNWIKGRTKQTKRARKSPRYPISVARFTHSTQQRKAGNTKGHEREGQKKRLALSAFQAALRFLTPRTRVFPSFLQPSQLFSKTNSAFHYTTKSHAAAASHCKRMPTPLPHTPSSLRHTRTYIERQ